MQRRPNNGALAGGLLLAVLLFGANNTGVKYMLRFWPPMTLGASRLIIAGWLLLALLRWTPFFGKTHPLTPALKKHLWWRTGLAMALYIIVFYNALRLTSVSHVALYLGAAPVWALLWEGPPRKNWKSVQRYGAAALAFCGVAILVGPSLTQGNVKWLGEVLGLLTSMVWTYFGRQCRAIGEHLSGAEMSAHTFWRGGLLLLPFSLMELAHGHYPWRWDLAAIQAFCIVGGAIIAFALWNTALRHWKTSQVLIFNNLVPISTMTWAHFCLQEPFSRTFWIAMLFIGGGVLIGQTNLHKIFGDFWLPSE